MLRSSRRAAFCLSAAALAACKPDAPPPAPASAAPVATTSAAPAASSGSGAVAPLPSPSSSPFSIVARSPDAFELYPLKGGAFVDAAGFLALLGEGPLRQSPAVMKGLEKGETGKILGAYPDGAWLVAADGTYKWTRDRWAKNELLREHETLLDVAAWGDNRAIAAIAMPGNDMRFFLVGGKPGVVMPAPYPADKVKADGGGEEPAPADGDDKAADSSCKVKMKPGELVLGGLPTGELYAAGYACEATGHGGAVVERWEPKKVRGTVEPLPKPESGHDPDVHGVLARSPGEVFVYGTEGLPPTPYLARFDGKAWSLDKAPFGGGIDALTAADDGTLWAVAGGAVWKKPVTMGETPKPPGPAAWEQVPLPAGVTAQAVWPRTAADVWVTGREGGAAPQPAGAGVLLRTGKVEAALALPPRNAMSAMITANRRFVATSACDKVYAHLYTLGPSKDAATGKPTEVPKGFAALKPVFEGELSTLAPIVEDDGAHLYVGVPVPSLAVGHKLLDAYHEKNPKTASNLFCHEPVIVKQAIKLQ